MWKSAQYMDWELKQKIRKSMTQEELEKDKQKFLLNLEKKGFSWFWNRYADPEYISFAHEDAMDDFIEYLEKNYDKDAESLLEHFTSDLRRLGIYNDIKRLFEEWKSQYLSKNKQSSLRRYNMKRYAWNANYDIISGDLSEPTEIVSSIIDFLTEKGYHVIDVTLAPYYLFLIVSEKEISEKEIKKLLKEDFEIENIEDIEIYRYS